MVFSKATNYALRALIYLATHPQDSYYPIKKISSELDISFHFLTKILQSLSQHGLITSYRGPGGGVRLARKASEINLLEIALVTEGEEFLQGCIMDVAYCEHETPCPLHEAWSVAKQALLSKFQQTTLDQLAQQLVQGDIQIALPRTKPQKPSNQTEEA